MDNQTSDKAVAEYIQDFQEINFEDPNWGYTYALQKVGIQFEFLVTDKNLGFNVENRPCGSGLSKIHLLECGHTVYWGPKPTVCGSTCVPPTQTRMNQGFYCTLCFRRAYNYERGRHNHRWEELFLPRFVNKEKEDEDVEKFKAVFRYGHPCYVFLGASSWASGWAILPRNNASIALIQLLEQKKVEAAEKLIENTCKHFGLDEESTKFCLTTFDRLLNHHHVLRFQNVQVVAAKAIKLSRDSKFEKMDAKELCEHMHVDFDAYCDWLDEASSVFKSLLAADVAQRFVRKAPKKISGQKGFNRVEVVAMRIWKAIVAGRIFPHRELRQHYKPIMASCVYIALVELKIRDIWLQRMVEILDYPEEEMSNFTDMLNRVQRFAKRTNWLGVRQRKDMRKRLLMKEEQKEAEAGDVTQLLSNAFSL